VSNDIGQQWVLLNVVMRFTVQLKVGEFLVHGVRAVEALYNVSIYAKSTKTIYNPRCVMGLLFMKLQV
jgi:hypothetical protein